MNDAREQGSQGSRRAMRNTAPPRSAPTWSSLLCVSGLVCVSGLGFVCVEVDADELVADLLRTIGERASFVRNGFAHFTAEVARVRPRLRKQLIVFDDRVDAQRVLVEETNAFYHHRFFSSGHAEEQFGFRIDLRRLNDESVAFPATDGMTLEIRIGFIFGRM